MPRRKSTDRQLRLLDSPIDQTPRPVAVVAVDRPIDRTYSYGVPERLRERLGPGCRVRVPFGRNEKIVEGMCVSVTEEIVETTLRNVEELLDDRPLLGPTLLELGQWISRYYCCPLGVTLPALVPAPARDQAGRRKARFAVACVGAASVADEKKSPKQQAVLEALWAGGQGGLPVGELTAAAGVTEAPVRSLAKRGWVRVETRFIDDEEASQPEVVDPPFELTPDQGLALEQIAAAIDEGVFRAILLFGVTGSGKTEVYVRAIRAAIGRGQQAILLVPEIALTAQTAQRLSSRFRRAAVLHASLSAAARGRAWRAIEAGKIDIVIGTRSAVFAPLPNPGLIVVDEEHEGSYKNLAAPRYNTRDVATKRAQLESIPIVLGSATPSLETWLNCRRQEHFHRVDLPSRVLGLPMPKVELVDMRQQRRGRDPGAVLLSAQLESALGRTVDVGQQAVLLLNRRGYSNVLACRMCGHVVACVHCRASMVYHRKDPRLICHHCHRQLPVPGFCQVLGCGGPLRPMGMGTERVADEVARKLPRARIARMDSDAIAEAGPGTRGADGMGRYTRFLNDFAAGRVNVLIGTQMIGKGLDFPLVTLVGIINADTALGMPDFRAAERTFQLVAQVAGRAGRSELPGRVIVQSFYPQEPALQKALTHDYAGFAEIELASRQRTNLPPVSRMARIVLSDPSSQRASAAAAEIAERAQALAQRENLPLQVLPPAPAAIERVRDRFRFEVKLLTPTAGHLQAIMDLLRGHKALSPRVRHVMIDVDPVSLL